MNTQLTNLKPERLWYYFNEILKIPRPSKKEEKITAYLENFGHAQNLETLKDNIGNILIRKPATQGKEKAKSVVLQSHVDMVCEKNADTKHDFENDPIKAYIDGEWVKAKGTTLGADDGIGIAAQLAILEAKNIEHGPIECLFTVDEETGLTGAFGLQADFLKSSILLNLDSEDEGQLFIGCAGGKDTLIDFPYKKENTPRNNLSFKLVVNGLKGGHSGDDIGKGLGNANKILNRFLWDAAKNFDMRLSHFDGGNLRNAIAREAYAIITIPEKAENEFLYAVKAYKTTIQEELKITDTLVNFYAEPATTPSFVIDQVSQSKLINALYACPHGVIAYSAEIPGFVETSTNLASVKTFDSLIEITTSQRSSAESSKHDIGNMVSSVFKLAGAKTKHTDGYPGWKPNPDSEIVALSVASYKKLFGKTPEVLAIHAGLECGLIGDKYPGMDMISFGPTIKGAHSPDERLHIESTQKFWNLLIEILKNVKTR